MTDGVAPIDQSLLPAAVRNGSKERKENYQAALSFERVLVGQLTEQLTKSSGSDDEEGGDAATQMLKQQMPSTLADALMAGGGIGLASQMDQMWQQNAGAAANAPKTTSLSDTAATSGASTSGAAAITTDGSAEA